MREMAWKKIKNVSDFTDNNFDLVKFIYFRFFFYFVSKINVGNGMKKKLKIFQILWKLFWFG